MPEFCPGEHECCRLIERIEIQRSMGQIAGPEYQPILQSTLRRDFQRLDPLPTKLFLICMQPGFVPVRQQVRGPEKEVEVRGTPGLFIEHLFELPAQTVQIDLHGIRQLQPPVGIAEHPGELMMDVVQANAQAV